MIGERLSEIRKDHGDTQASLAKKLGVSLATIRSWEQENSSPSHEMLVAICRLYQVSSDYLLGLTNHGSYYNQQRHFERLNQSELTALLDYEDFLIWKRKN